MVEASCGHWPSGWQMNVSWPAMDYVGVDVMPGVIEEDKQLLWPRRGGYPRPTGA